MPQFHPERTCRTSEDSARAATDALTIRRCVACDTLFAPTTARCSACRSDELEPVVAAGTGSIVCWRTVECAPNALTDPVPATLAIVELDEGPWVYTTIAGPVPQAAGTPVRVRFRTPPKGDRFPVFAVTRETTVPAT
ncbi:Zn-ribbon domain-containing OB-fold protein [Nocardia carnea]|uniref:Zn-ribbon domain-containing OB-fold protein n=1 Tax=Nocardia carnea TaxID=37328 RepID=UPI00245637E6|nr:OB-fold domain-containing protein [Nocardia carnea]